MTAPGHCWPLRNELIALAEWIRVQRQEKRVQSQVREDSRYVSRYISQGSEIPRGDIESQESRKVALDSLAERINNGEGREEVREGSQARGGARAWP
jgi:hypothetical protein